MAKTFVTKGTRMRRRMLATMHYSLLDRLFQQVDSALGMILMFHHVSSAPVEKFAPNAHLAVHPWFLEATLEMLKRRGIEIVSLIEARKRILSGARGGRFAAITFDDGYRDNLTEALPILEKYEAPFTIYVATGLVEGTADLWWRGVEALVRQQQHLVVQTETGLLKLDCSGIAEKAAAFDQLLTYLTTELSEKQQRQCVRELCWLYKIDLDAMRREAMMDWHEIRQIEAHPLGMIGAHTIHHYALARLEATKARQEIRQSMAVLQSEIGRVPRHFAYPYGYPAAAGPREFNIALKQRVHTAVTTRPGFVYPAHAEHMTALPRISINGLFQRRRYLGPLLTGLPTRLANKGRKLNVH